MGLDIGTSAVRAAELSFGKAGATLERFGQVALPSGCVRDGEVVDADLVASAIRQLWAQAKFSSKRVVVGVANQKVVVRQVEVDWMPLPELKKSLAFQVQDFIPMPVEQAILDFHPLEEFTADSGARMLRVLLVAASRDMVGSAMQAVSLAGLQPVMVDLTSFAVLRSLVSHSGIGTFESEALVDLGSSVTNIVVHQGGVPRFVRILLMGGSHITDLVAERMGVSIDQAESVKQASGLGQELVDGVRHPASKAIEQSGTSLVEEISASLAYYAAQPGAARIGRVVLSGGGSMLQGLSQRLSAATRLPVELAHPLAGVRLGKTGLTDEQLAYVEPMITVPVGLAMGLAS